MTRATLTLAFAILLAACGGASTTSEASAADSASKPFIVTPVARFAQPWAMAVLLDGRMLVTERAGALQLVSADGRRVKALGGVPRVAYGGQGGLGDVVLHPDFANSRYVYLSYAEPGAGGTAGAAVGRGRLTEAGIEGFQVIWRQEPKVSGQGHYGHRLAFSPDGFLFISSGERQKFDPAQDMTANLGKIIRLTDAGGIPSDNPFYDQGRVKAQIWSWGHRNPLGLAFAPDGALWEHEMGPKGGDEVNRIEKGANYGWPIVSNGSHYDGRDIPDHPARPEYEAPKLWWTPSVSPAGLIVYTGDRFPAWKGSLLLGGLSSQSLIRVAIEGGAAREAERFDMGARIREVEQAPDGSVYVLEDERNGAGGRLLRLTPKG